VKKNKKIKWWFNAFLNSSNIPDGKEAKEIDEVVGGL
jgi:hypothetical protein